MNILSLESSLKVNDDVVFRELEGEAVILNVASGMYFGLDAVGTRMWQLIAERSHLGSVAGTLVSEYDAPPSVVEADLVRLAGELVAKGLLVPVR